MRGEPNLRHVRCLALLLFSPWVVPSQATELVEWRSVPISILLTVDEERVLTFPDHVQVGIPPTLTPDHFRTQSTGGTVLWLARQPFEAQRLQVRLLGTGHVMLFDVTALEGAGAAVLEPVQVSLPETDVDSQARPLNAGARATPLTPVMLTRFAAQQLYAPRRLLREIAGVRRVPMGSPEVVPLYGSEPVVATPLGSWQGGGLYVTAVKLTNQGSERVVLDPRELTGQFVTATFQHNSLGPVGSPSDTTCVYLVTHQPFVASIPSDHAATAVSADSGG